MIKKLVKRFSKIKLNGIYQDILKNYTDGVIVTNDQKEIIWVNDAFTKITGYELEEVLGKNPNILKSNLQNKAFYETMWKRIEQTNSWQGQIWNKKKNNEIYPQWLHIFTIKNSKGKVKYYVSVFKDLGEIDSINKKVLLMIQKDTLTSLYNRTYFIEEVMNQLLDHSKSHYLIFLDINSFKYINDTFGHMAGDDLIIEYSKQLLVTFKDQLIARYAGDEFVVFFNSDVNKEKLIELIEKLTYTFRYKDHEIEINSSIGIVNSKIDGTTLDDLINKADIAMYHAKNNNLNYAFYSEMSKS